MGRGNSCRSSSQRVSCPQQCKTCISIHTQKNSKHDGMHFHFSLGFLPLLIPMYFFFHFVFVCFATKNLTRQSEYQSRESPSISEMTQGETYPTHFYVFWGSCFYLFYLGGHHPTPHVAIQFVDMHISLSSFLPFLNFFFKQHHHTQLLTHNYSFNNVPLTANPSSPFSPKKKLFVVTWILLIRKHFFSVFLFSLCLFFIVFMFLVFAEMQPPKHLEPNLSLSGEKSSIWCPFFWRQNPASTNLCFCAVAKIFFFRGDTQKKVTACTTSITKKKKKFYLA